MVFQVWSEEPCGGVSETLLGSLWSPDYFNNHPAMLFAFFTGGAEAVVGKTAGPLAWIKIVTPNCYIHCNLHHPTCMCSKSNLRISLMTQ